MSFSEKMKTIVVATDLGEKSEAALEYARKLAAAYGARIVLAHGLDPLEYAAVETVPGKILRRMPEQARAVLDEMVAGLLREGIHSHSELLQGAVVDILLEIAKEHRAGLIVVGTRGRHGAGPIAVGTIVEQLVRRSTCPVLAVAADWNAGEFRPTPGGPIMLAAEKNNAMSSAIEAAQSIAGTFHRTLIVVHGRTAAEVSAILNPGSTTPEQFGIVTTNEQPVRYVVKDGQPVEAIEQAIEQYHPAILIAGVKRKSDSPGPHGTIFSLLAAARVPMLCVPEQEIPAIADAEQSLAITS